MASAPVEQKPRWQRAYEMAQAGASIRKISFVLDLEERQVYALLGTAQMILSRRHGPVKAPLTLAEWMCEPYMDEDVRAWVRREVEAWEARRR